MLRYKNLLFGSLLQEEELKIKNSLKDVHLNSFSISNGYLEKSPLSFGKNALLEKQITFYCLLLQLLLLKHGRRDSWGYKLEDKWKMDELE